MAGLYGMRITCPLSCLGKEDGHKKVHAVRFSLFQVLDGSELRNTSYREAGARQVEETVAGVPRIFEWCFSGYVRLSELIKLGETHSNWKNK